MAVKHYYYCRHQGNLQIQHAASPKLAILGAWGSLVGTYFDLGTRDPRTFSFKRKQQIQENPQGWQDATELT